MRIELACFTEQGGRLGARLVRQLEESGEDAARLERCGAGGVPLRQWVDKRFAAADALVFIGAAGIAVRAIAPRLVSKLADPAVVVVDDCGRFAIALVSGHIGGANALAGRIAALVGAVPVVTTATDANGLFAVDTWARANGLAIVNPEKIKHVSAKLLSGKPVALETPFPVMGPLPKGIVAASNSAFDIRVAVRRPANDDALLLVPRIAALGVGCRKGAPVEDIEAAFTAFCDSSGMLPEAFAKVCSIDIKKNEPGLVAFCVKRSLPLVVYDATRLMEAEGAFAASEFVNAVTGADNVCERSAVLGSGGELLARKFVARGVTMAAAAGGYTVTFPDEDGETAWEE